MSAVNSFLQAFGFLTPKQFEKAKQVNASYRERRELWAINAFRALGGTGFGPITGAYNLYHLFARGGNDEYNYYKQQEDEYRNKAFKIGSLVHAILEILCLSLIADLLVTVGRTLYISCKECGRIRQTNRGTTL